jgi:alpha-glucosidase (family GH31 glycosyl hydrolase)
VNFRKTEAKWTVFNRAGDQEIDYGTGNNTYGHYPFYLLIDDNQEAHLAYLRSTHAMDVIISELDGRRYLTYKVVGGVVSFRFSLGDSDVLGLVRRFQAEVIGKSAIPPFWSLGFHQSRWGYQSVADLR